jgi:hypothetical protein
MSEEHKRSLEILEYQVELLRQHLASTKNTNDTLDKFIEVFTLANDTMDELSKQVQMLCALVHQAGRDYSVLNSQN